MNLEEMDAYLNSDPEYVKAGIELRHLFLIGNALTDARRLRGVSVKDLAALSGISARVIMRIECYSLDPRLSTLRKLADALNCDLVINLEIIDE